MEITTIALIAGAYYVIMQNKAKQAEAAIAAATAPRLSVSSALNTTPIKQAMVDSVSIAPTTSTARANQVQTPILDPVYNVPIQKPVETTTAATIQPVPVVPVRIVPTEISTPITVVPQPIVSTVLPPVQTQILPPQQTIAPIVSQPGIPAPLPAINTVATTTTTIPPISGLLYVIKPDVLVGGLSLVLTHNQSINTYVGTIDDLYTQYDALSHIPELESAKLISQYSTPEFASVFSYYDDLLKMQLQYYKDRQAILNERTAKGKPATGNDRILQILNIIVDNQKYGSLPPNEQVNYMPIELFSLPKGQTSTLDVIILPNKPRTYIGPYYVPSDGKSHTYHILSKNYNYPSGYIFGFIQTADNAVVEFVFTNLYGEYASRQIPGYFEYTAKLFLDAMSQQKFITVTNYFKIPAWSTVRISGRIVSNPTYEVVAEILKDNTLFPHVSIDNLLMAKKYDVPISAITGIISFYREYLVQHPNEKPSIQAWYSEKVMVPPLHFPAASADYPAYAVKVDAAMLKNYRILAGSKHFQNTIQTTTAFGSSSMKTDFNYYNARSFYTH